MPSVMAATAMQFEVNHVQQDLFDGPNKKKYSDFFEAGGLRWCGVTSTGCNNLAFSSFECTRSHCSACQGVMFQRPAEIAIQEVARDINKHRHRFFLVSGKLTDCWISIRERFSAPTRVHDVHGSVASCKWRYTAGSASK
jgi:hypothetical protein